MQGSLKEIQLPEVLQFISMGKSSGMLTLRHHGTEIVLYILEGRIINSSSLQRQRRLGDLLIYRGILKRSELAQILNLQRTIESDKRLGEILVEREIVTDNTIRDVLRLQLEEEIWNLFGWEDGDFNFEPQDKASLGEPIVQIDIEPLLLEGTRRHDEWRKIVKILSSDSLVPHVAPLTQGEEKVEKFSPTEWKVLAQVNGKFSIRAIVNRSGMGRFEVYRILYDLLNKGALTLNPPQVDEDAPKSQHSAKPAIQKKKATGLLSLLTGGRSDASSEKLSFTTPIGLMAHFLNSLMEEVSATKDFKANPEDSQLLANIWRDLVMNFTKADLIKVEGNKVNPITMEKYFLLYDFSEHIRDSYEDAVEVIFQLIDIAYRYISQRIGERNAGRIVKELLSDISPRSTLQYESDFVLEERIQMILRLAA